MSSHTETLYVTGHRQKLFKFSLHFREAPLQFIPPLFGHWPFKHCVKNHLFWETMASLLNAYPLPLGVPSFFKSVIFTIQLTSFCFILKLGKTMQTCSAREGRVDKRSLDTPSRTWNHKFTFSIIQFSSYLQELEKAWFSSPFFFEKGIFQKHIFESPFSKSVLTQLYFSYSKSTFPRPCEVHCSNIVIGEELGYIHSKILGSQKPPIILTISPSVQI